MADRDGKIQDSARAIDARDLIKRARRRMLLRLLVQVILWGILILAVVGIFRCLSALSDYEPDLEVPTRESSAPAE